ncbi:MAG: LuxR family transcriptional regulator [Mesorhizobium sp.]|jgi:LuxR family quorum sensing-dependent transcriptional regulator
MLKVHSEALDFVERSQHYRTLQPLIDDFSTMVSGQGFTSFILTGLPVVGSNFDHLMICNHWPDEWSKRYEEQVYFPDDPVSKWSLSKDRPFHWTEAWDAHPDTIRVRQINGEAKEFGLVGGIAFPMRTNQGWQAVMSLASDRPVEASKRDEGMLLMASIYFQMAASDMIAVAERGVTLTAREREILQWAAIGKTAWETSHILNISEKTVRNHMNAIHLKFNVSSTTQAVVEALRTHQLHL